MVTSPEGTFVIIGWILEKSHLNCTHIAHILFFTTCCKHCNPDLFMDKGIWKNESINYNN